MIYRGEKPVHNITSKENSQLGFIRRNVRARSMKTREKLYNTLVRPHLEYAASLWDPHVTKQKQAIEKVQRRAARWVTNQHKSISSVKLCWTNWTGNHWQSDVPTPAFAYCRPTKLQMVLWPHHTFLISFSQSCSAFITTCAHTATCDIAMQDKLI